ncbi:MAG TPA: DUF1801 domain-containing protein [Bacteroidia bacterium]|nr:DUF1801 domain-containing protein [Bacteroidia bacterium]
MPMTPEAKEEILTKLKNAMRKCTPPMVITKESKDGMELTGNKAVPYGYDKKIIPGMFFTSCVARKDMVSFYFFPMYMAPEFLELIPEMSKILKGKTCFNIKKPEQIDEKELSALLKKGVTAWKKNGYMQ